FRRVLFQSKRLPDAWEIPIPVGSGGQGFLDCPLDDMPVWTDYHRFVWVTPKGHDQQALYLPMRRGDYTIGQDAQAPRLLVFQHSTATLYVAHEGYTPVASRLAVDGKGNPWVLPAGATSVIGREKFTPWAPPKPIYAPIVPIGRRLWFGPFAFGDAAGVPQNCRIPVVQGAPWLDVVG